MPVTTIDPSPFRRLSDPATGQWLVERLHADGDDWGRAKSVLPVGFDRVVRVLHPIDDPEVGDGSWAAIAETSGTQMHPLVQWNRIWHRWDPGGYSAESPQQGEMPPQCLALVLDHLPHPGELNYGLWVGFNCWTASPGADDPSLLRAPGREYVLYRGQFTETWRWPDVREVCRTPNLIWPDDHSWCLATEVDWDFTLVGCSPDDAENLLADNRLEAFEIGYDDDLTWAGDTVNPRPANAPRA